jgi:mono/diheme cytochrome c family protein
MLKPWFVLPAVLLFAGLPQQPAAPPASTPAPPAASPAPPASTPAQPSIPAEAAHMVNPVKATAESLARAKKMYGYDCAMCHGANGNGKGDITDLKPPPKDYTDPAALKDLSDGEIFYLLKNGKGQMPPDGGRTKPDDLWNMVVLVRSFAKK